MSYAPGTSVGGGPGTSVGHSQGVGGGASEYNYGTTPSQYDSDSRPDKDSKYPKILLMGLRRSGKSSIQKVVFHKMSPNETLFLESTSLIVKEDIANSSFFQFSIWDFPGQIDFFDSTFESEKIFDNCGAIIFVIDAQDDYSEAMATLSETITRAHNVSRDIKFEVFIHKVDGLSDDIKIETQRDIHQRSSDDLMESGLEDRVQLSFYLTSIYDHSIFEAFSKVIQKLIPQLPALEDLLNLFVSRTRIEKAFLFDVGSKIYIATDSSPVDMQSYELCCNMIDVVIDVSCIYGLSDENDESAFDHKSSSVIKLNNSTTLYLKEISRVLAMVCIFRSENYALPGIIDYNFGVIRDGIEKVFGVRDQLIGEAELGKSQLSTSFMHPESVEK
ncbi:ras-related GTP-binding protein C-like [Tigriopus californicus]|uniref:ras-related GTP-binding protein C-like n=1 Tax=Tigriopus californicus TaxID=6832 RepID=UPI0027DA59E0|nr:ras-related GTP-binding protein C-like [Tigriopus californicus]|eukprot:TCALIF_01013-PA protein Name:"Similar to RRAGD Ras-related GTP-binding protein D (Homo sapiens)" AED:0.22 eAED:0.22 QI:202/1/1/1/1/1/7/227/387